MSDTDGASGRSGPGSPGSSSDAGSGSGSSSTTETKPLSAVRPGSSGPSGSGSGGPGAKPGSAPSTGRGAPPKGAATATAVPAKTGSGRPPAAGGQGPAPAKKGVPAKKAAAPRPAPTGRRVRLTVSRVDPWSAMKVSFLLSVAIGIAGVVMVVVLWMVLKSMGLFDMVNDIASEVFSADGSAPFDIMDYVGLPRVISLSIVIGVIDVILITAIATLGAFLYNVSAALVGGVQLTLTDD